MRILLTGGFTPLGTEVLDALLLSSTTTTATVVTLLLLDKTSSETRQQHLASLKSDSAHRRRALRDGKLVVLYADLSAIDNQAATAGLSKKKQKAAAQAEQALLAAVRDQDCILHLAAVTSPWWLLADPDAAVQVNVTNTRRLIHACNQNSNNKQLPRIVFASTYTVYGVRGGGDQEPLLDASTAASPQDALARHKHECEQTFQGGEYRGEWCILVLGEVYYSNNQHAARALWQEHVVFPPRAPRPIASAPPAFNSAELDRMIFFATPADQPRHGVHVKDAAVAFANAAAAASASVHGKTLMIGGGEAWRGTHASMANKALEQLGLGPSFYPDAVFRRPADNAPHCYAYGGWMDTAEAESVLRFQQRTFVDWCGELRRDVGSGWYAMGHVALGPVLGALEAHWQPPSVHAAAVRRGREDPTAGQTLAQLVATATLGIKKPKPAGCCDDCGNCGNCNLDCNGC